MKYVLQPNEWETVVEALNEQGHTRTDDLGAADFLVFNGTAADFPTLPENIKFVQLCLAGIDAFFDAGHIDSSRRWANASGVYGRPVAESAVALLLSALHCHARCARMASFSIQDEIHEKTDWLYDTEVAIIGAGGIGHDLISMLKGFGCTVIAVNNSGRPVKGADETLDSSHTNEVLSRVDHAILAAPLTESTHHMINTETLKLMKPHSVLVNVGRGPLVNSDDLLEALKNGTISAAGLDVTDPEPLADDHGLFTQDNVIITLHTANTYRSMKRLMPPAIVKNLQALEAGERMPTEVDPDNGY